MMTEVVVAKQLGMDLELGAVWQGLFWCCCPHMSQEHSLAWQPPDYKTGRCAYCGKEYTFETREGKGEGDEPTVVG